MTSKDVRGTPEEQHHALTMVIWIFVCGLSTIGFAFIDAFTRLEMSWFSFAATGAAMLLMIYGLIYGLRERNRFYQKFELVLRRRT